MTPTILSRACTAADPSQAHLAHAVVSAVLDEAAQRGMRLCVAVVDAGGHLLAFSRMQGVSFHLISVAQDKAITAASFGVSTRELAAGLDRRPSGTREFFATRPNVVLLGGGVPLTLNGVLLGGIGVSGASAMDDEACALAALEACVKNP